MKYYLVLILSILYLQFLDVSKSNGNTNGIVMYNDGSPPIMDKDHKKIFPSNINITYLVENALINIKKYMKRGNKRHKIAKLDPFHFHEKNIIYKDDLRVHGKLKGEMVNLSKFKWDRLYACLFSMVFQFDVLLHDITLKGVYDLNGTIADIFPVYGSGHFRFEIDKLNFTITNQFNPRRGDRPIHEKFAHVNLNTIEGAKWNLGDILGGGQLSQIVNNFTNDITVPVIKRVIGLLEEFFSGVFQMAVEDILVKKKASMNKVIRYLKTFKKTP